MKVVKCVVAEVKGMSVFRAKQKTKNIDMYGHVGHICACIGMCGHV